MRIPFQGKLVIGAKQIECVGNLVDGPRRLRLGHATLDSIEDIRAISVAAGNQEKIELLQEPHKPAEISIDVIEFESLTLRFTAK